MLMLRDKYSHKCILLPCSKCGKPRIVRVVKGKPLTELCQKCAHQKSRPPRDWHKTINTGGYVSVHLDPNDFFYPMCNKAGYVYEHRLVMAKLVGRCLHSWEIVHHKGTKYPSGSRENRADNGKENLQLVSDDRHKQITLLENRIARLEKLLELKCQ